MDFLSGTFITEWNEGFERCTAFLGNKKLRTQVIDKLVAIATECNFEGWLINIENKIEVLSILDYK